MRVVVVAPYALYTPHFETDLEIVQSHLDGGDQVTIIVCQGLLRSCDVNRHHLVTQCARCIGRQRRGISVLSPHARLRVVALSSLPGWSQEIGLPARFDSVEQLRDFEYGGFDAGYAVLSSIVSMLRDPAPDLTKHQKTIQDLLRGSVRVFLAMVDYLRREEVDRVYVYNGRYGLLRPVLRSCQRVGVDCHTHERGHDISHFTTFHNTLPHDIDYVEREIQHAWRRAAGSGNREDVASEFFRRRAEGVMTSWYSFTAHQQAGLLPEGWDPDTRNVVAFTSSEDEFVAIGDQWTSGLYPDQVEGLRRIIGDGFSVGGASRFLVRVHPNLKGVDNASVRDVLALDGPMVTVIPPESTVSSYALLKAADVVLTFGSSIGIEAVFWGTPSVLAGPCFYGGLGGTYNPRSHSELIDMLKSDLAPKDPTPALMYGYYLATFGRPFRYFEPTGLFKGRFRGVELTPERWVSLVVRMNKVPLLGRLLDGGWRWWSRIRAGDSSPGNR